MTDLSQTISPKSQQLNADDMIAGPMTITVTKVSANEGNPEQPIAISFDGDGGKPYLPCKSMRRVLVATWGADGQAFVGRSMTLYRDPEVAFGGLKVGGIRISHMTHLDRDMTMALTASKAQRKPYTVRRMEAPKPAAQPPKTEAPAADLASLKARAELAAQQGTVTLGAFWQEQLTKPDRKAMADDLPGLREKAAAADARGAPTEADPFTPGDDTPDADERQPGEEG